MILVFFDSNNFRILTHFIETWTQPNTSSNPHISLPSTSPLETLPTKLTSNQILLYLSANKLPERPSWIMSQEFSKQDSSQLSWVPQEPAKQLYSTFWQGGSLNFKEIYTPTTSPTTSKLLVTLPTMWCKVIFLCKL